MPKLASAVIPYRPRPAHVGVGKAAIATAQVLFWHARGRPSEAGLRILYYHRIAADKDQLALDPRRFAREMELIADSGQRVVDLYTFQLDDTSRIDENVVALTFDDGYHDFLDAALPELERRRWPATVFIVPEAIDGGVRFPWYSRDDHPRLLSWDEIRRIERGGLVRFEPHSLTHPFLPGESDRVVWREIAGSKAAVEDALGRPARLFCYPGGFYTDREAAMVERAGYVAAFGCEYGVNRPPWRRFQMRRTIADRYDSDLIFAGRLVGGTDRAPLGRSRRDQRHERIA